MDRTNSLGLWTYGQEFYEAADIIRRDKGEVSTVVYYLACHSLELLMKAFLRGKGYSLDKLKYDMGHDLKKILDLAERENIKELFKIKDEHRVALSMISEFYKSKEFEYITTGAKTFPHIDILLKLAQELLANTMQFCFERMQEHDI